MTTILKGDTSKAITIALSDGFDYSGKTVVVEYQGVRRSFSNAVAGGDITFSFAAEETAPMSLGTYPVRVWIEGGGEVVTVHNADVKLCVTDCIADVHSGGAIYLDVHGGLYGIEGLPERYTDEDVRRKINEIVRRGGGVVAALLLCATAAFGASVEVQTAPKGTIYNNQPVVTNVTVDVSDKADKTNTYTKAETDAKIVELSPAPGDYETVSNAAMNALSVTGGTMLGDIDMGGRHADGEQEPEDSAFVKFMEYWLGYGELGSGFGIYEYSDGFLNVKYTFNGSGWLSEYGNETDVMTREDLADALGDIPQPELSQYAKLYALEAVSNKVETTATIVDSWEGYWGATNVELQVTNFYGNTSGALPRLRIREFRDGHWTNVWDEIDKFIACKAEILHEVAQSNATLLAEADRKYAPKVWGAYTDRGTTNVIPNSVYMSSPETYFGGGTEFQRVAVGSGAVSVLVDRGALAKTTGEPGTFRFQDAGGTNYFGFVKSDSYTIGCRTDGISVGAGNAITLRYDVIMAGEDVPVVYWKQRLESATPWAQLNNPDGTAADGAPYAVTWLQDGGSYYATVNCGGSPSGFFVAETSVAGDVVWETNMKARLGGGIECTNTASNATGVIRPKYNGSTVTWEWSAR